ncbi:MAG: DUF3604 domain-containing protein [Pseudomonadales bacterium]
MRSFIFVLVGLLAAGAVQAAGPPAAGESERRLLWGDTHLHTSYSFDAFLNGNMSIDPDGAYRFARGVPVIHPYHRARVQIGRPLDFLVVSDHAEFLGGIRDIYYDGIQDEEANFLVQLLYRYNEWRIRRAIDAGQGADYFRDLLPERGDPGEAAARWRDDVAAAAPGAEASGRNAWQRIAEAAERHNEPGRFTALIGWEWSSNPGGANLHRIVVTDADAARARTFMPFSSGDSPYPEDLWRWLDETATATGSRFVAIPHNSNISKGLMFGEQTLAGEPMGAEHAALRRRFEPVAEITQIKGDSETHPALSPDDAFADFEPYEHYIQQQPEPYQPRPGDYLRPALLTGLVLADRIGVNPFELGVIGSTDSHTGVSTAEEPNFWGKMAFDSIPENKQVDALTRGPTGWSMSAAGLAAVWAEDNTREAIVGALLRREVYATTGPRIRLRLFAGWGFGQSELDAADWVSLGYQGGVPMGGTLKPAAGDGAAPSLMIAAEADPESGHLDRLQVIKGWLDGDGRTRERVYDVAWSGDRQPDARGNLPPVGDSVDRSRGTFTNTIGAPELRVVWRDPDFDPTRPAFYYVRVLEIPTPRHALLDALALGLEAPAEGPAVIQERAYSSPVWYAP